MEVKMEVNSLRSWKLKRTLHLLSAVVLSCTQCITSTLTSCEFTRIIPSKQNLRNRLCRFASRRKFNKDYKCLVVNLLIQ